MSSTGILRDLAEFFAPVGFIGAVIAVLCALIALIAFAWGAAGVVGGAVGVWIVGALLSLASGFSGEWMPTIAAGGALLVALVAGGVLRGIVVALAPRSKPVQAGLEQSRAATAVAPARPAAPVVAAPVAAAPVAAAPVAVATASVVTVPRARAAA